MITSYSTLVSAVKNFTELDDPNDVDPIMPVIGQLAQQRLSRDFQPPGLIFRDPTEYLVNTSTGKITTTVVGETFRGFNALYWTSVSTPNFENPLFYRTPEYVFDYINDDTRGEPKFYTRVGVDIYVAPIPDSTASAHVVASYYVQPTAATSTHETNYYTANVPSLLFYAAMAEASRFMKNPTAVGLWEQAYGQELLRVGNDDRRNRRDSQKAPGSPVGTNTQTGGP